MQSYCLTLTMRNMVCGTIENEKKRETRTQEENAVCDKIKQMQNA